MEKYDGISSNNCANVKGSPHHINHIVWIIKLVGLMAKNTDFWPTVLLIEKSHNSHGCTEIWSDFSGHFYLKSGALWISAISFICLILRSNSACSARPPLPPLPALLNQVSLINIPLISLCLVSLRDKLFLCLILAAPTSTFFFQFTFSFTFMLCMCSLLCPYWLMSVM